MKSKYFRLAIQSFMIALTFILMNTPLGTISFGVVSVTIAHVPILIITILLGFKEGFITALFFGIFSLLTAIFAPKGVLDPLFINPLISILPRLMIPVVTHGVYTLVSKWKNSIGVITGVIFGNLTNTFFVYFSMYLFMKKRVELLLGKSFGAIILGLVGTTTVLKTIGVAIITVPIILALQKNLQIPVKERKRTT